MFIYEPALSFGSGISTKASFLCFPKAITEISPQNASGCSNTEPHIQQLLWSMGALHSGSSSHTVPPLPVPLFSSESWVPSSSALQVILDFVSVTNARITLSFFFSIIKAILGQSRTLKNIEDKENNLCTATTEKEARTHRSTHCNWWVGATSFSLRVPSSLGLAPILSQSICRHVNYVSLLLPCWLPKYGCFLIFIILIKTPSLVVSAKPTHGPQGILFFLTSLNRCYNLWWLILIINLIGYKIILEICLWVALWRYFWEELAKEEDPTPWVGSTCTYRGRHI